MSDSLSSTSWRHENTNRKIGIRLAAITIAISLLPLAYTPLAVAQPTLPPTIGGIPIPSQGKEGDTMGYFAITGIASTGGSSARGIFTASVTYEFFQIGGPGPDRGVGTVNSVVNGVYAIRGEKIMLQFKGAGFRGQLTGTLNEGFIGFINTHGNGYLSQVFVAGVPE